MTTDLFVSIVEKLGEVFAPLPFRYIPFLRWLSWL